MIDSVTAPFQYTSGPHDAKIALVGEAWGAQEAITKRPFVGPSGQELTRLLSSANIHRAECFLTNVFPFQPQNNDILALCGKKADAGADYTLPPYKPGAYFLPEYLPEIDRLKAELVEVRPHVIIALGATATWALLSSSAIKILRGTIHLSPWGKVLPTYHPAYLLRDPSGRPIVQADLLKAQREAATPELIRPNRQIIINPTLDDIHNWISNALHATHMTVDIETKFKQISCIGFACSRDLALVIPFFDPQTAKSYWADAVTEVATWQLVRHILALPAKKIFQNGLFDLSYLLRMGIFPTNCREDTMLLHHSLYPEMEKGLGFLGSIYTNESSWKLMRTHTDEELKSDD